MMKKIILITMLMSAVFAQSDCNTRNWQDYYNSDGKDMSGCDLRSALTILKYADLTGANLTGADLKDAALGYATLTGANLTGADLTRADFSYATLKDVKSGKIIGTPFLPAGWSLVGRTLINDEWGSSNPPDDMMTDGDNPDDMMTDADDPSDMMADGDNPSDMMADRELSDELHSKIRGNKRRINLYQWNAWEKKNDPQVSKGKTTFRHIDKNNDGKIGTGEFFQFYQRWIQD